MKTLSRILFAVLAAGLLTSPSLQAKGATATAAAACKKLEKCPYFSDVYKGDKTFRESFSALIKKARVGKLWWFPSGVETPMAPVLIDGKIYIYSTVCQPHNCSNQWIAALYNPEQKRAIGRFTSEDSHNIIWLGSPSTLEKKIILDFDDPKSSLSKGYNYNNMPLPLKAD